MPDSVWAVVVAAGQGTRFGGRKQFAVVGTRSVLEHAVAAVAPTSDGIVVVLPPDLAGRPDAPDALGLRPEAATSELKVACGRESRAGSVRAGLEAVPSHCRIVVVHDAARPLASPSLCERVVGAVRAGADGAIPVLALTDTVKRVAGSEVVETLDRSALVRVQTPQAFEAAALRAAHAGDPEATDDAGLVERRGGRVVVVPGEEANVKLTSASDLALVSWWHGQLSSAGAGDGVGTVTARPGSEP